MATFRGHGGAIDFGAGFDIYITSWTIDTATDEFDITKLSSTTATGVRWKEFTFGCSEWSGSAEGFMDDATIVTPTDFGKLITGTFTDGAGNTRTGQAFVTSSSETNSATDLGRLTFNFRGTNTLTWA